MRFWNFATSYNCVDSKNLPLERLRFKSWHVQCLPFRQITLWKSYNGALTFNVQFSIPSSLSYQTSWYPSPQLQSFSNTVSKLHVCSFTRAITLWLSCILGLISILLFAKYVNVLQWAIKQRRKKTEPRTKLTHNRYMHHSHFLDLDFSFFSLDSCFCSCSYSDFFYDAFGHLKETRRQTL